MMDNSNIHGEAFNFSTEHPYSVLEIVQKIITTMGSDIKPEILNQSSNEIKDQYLSATKAKQILNWKSKYDLDSSLVETINWYTQFFNSDNKSQLS
jgi:CDP-glucose 4,6-dehydratase